MVEAHEVVSSLIRNLKEEGLEVITKEEYGKNIIFIKKDNIEKMRLYVKVSSIENPFWGLTKNRIDKLQSEVQICDFKVILISKDCSITLSSSDVTKIISRKNVASDGDYKITVSDLTPFWTVEKAIKKFFNGDR